MSQFYMETPAGGTPTVQFNLPDANTVTPDGSGIVYITESAGLDITGAVANTINVALDITEVGTLADTFTADTGSAQPAANNLNIVGGEGIDTSGATDTLTIAGEDASDSNKGIASFVVADFSVSSGAVSLVDTVVKSVAGDTGTATPSGHSFTIAGGSGVTTSASGSTVTIALSGGGTAIDSLTTDVSGPTVPDANGTITVTGTSIFSDGTTLNTLTLNVEATSNTFLYGQGADTNVAELGPLTDGQLIIGATAGAPAAATLTAGTGISITNGTNTITIDADNNGDVTGPGSSTDNAIARFDGTTGKIIQNSGVTISDTNVVDGATQLNVDNLRLDGNTVSTTDTNGDLNLTPDGTGIVISSASIRLPNDTYLVGRNAANSADINMFKVDAADQIDTGATLVTRSLFPFSDSFYNLGTTGSRYLNGYFDDVSITNDLAVSEGGTGVSSFTAYSVICGGTTASGDLQNVSGVGSSGQVLTSNGASSLPTWQDASGGGITWNEVTGTSQTAAVDNGYYCNNAALVTVTLPDTAAAGSIVRVAGKGAGGWKVGQNAGETIHFLGDSTTTGTGGSLASTNQYDAVELLCITADTDWVVISSVGNITVT